MHTHTHTHTHTCARPALPPLSTLDRLQRGLPLARPHRIFDGKLLDVNVLREVVNTWLTGGEINDNDENENALIDSSAISLALVDAHFAWSLYHHIEIKRTFHSNQLRAWERRLGEANGSGDTNHHDDASQLHFVPRFRVVEFDSIDEVTRVHPRLRFRIIDRKCCVRVGDDEDDVDDEDILEDDSDWASTYVHGDREAYNENEDDEDGDEDVNESDSESSSSSSDGNQLESLVAWLTVCGSLGTIGGRTFVTQLCRMQQLRVVDVQQADNQAMDCFSSATGRAFATALRHLPRLHTLIVGKFRLGKKSMLALSAALGHVPTLRVLKLNGNFLGTRAARVFAASMQRLSELRVLQLMNANIGAEGCRALAASLHHVPQLTSLDLYDNSIGYEGCLALAASLHHVPQLTSLDVGADDIYADAAHTLSAAMQQLLPNLSTFNGIVLPRGVDVTSLDLSSKRLVIVDMIFIAASLHHVPQLTSLNLKTTDAEGCRALAASLPRCLAASRATIDIAESEIQLHLRRRLFGTRFVAASRASIVDVGSDAQHRR
jgi:hypothetical protein